MQCGLEDTSLPRMPTPTATPRGVATPRAGEEATLAKTLNFCAYLPFNCTHERGKSRG